MVSPNDEAGAADSELAQDIMYALLSAFMLIGILASAQGAETPVSEGMSGRPEPCYVVIAVDVSGGMESIDAPTSDAAGRRQTLRDEGQLVLLQLLPFMRSNLYVGVAHFSDKVRYSLPNKETGPLLPWGQTYLTESAYRNMVRPAEFEASFRNDIPEVMDWALQRIQAARRQYGQGPAKLIILSNGAPRDSARELDRGTGPTLTMAKRLTELQVQIHPILINETSFRPGGARGRLSDRGQAAEDLMHSIASMSGGGVHRLRRDHGFVDILMDIFDLGMPVDGDLVVSPHDWGIVVAGSPLEQVVVRPPKGHDVVGPRILATKGGLETASGIYANIISSPQHQATIMRRPETRNLINRSWQGRWDFKWPDEPSRAAVRIYRIPEFLLQLEAAPELPWWLHEQVQLRVHLRHRHEENPALQDTEPSEDGDKLSVRIRAQSAGEAAPLALEEGRWAVPGRLYETEPFTIGAPGLYKLACELWDSVGDANLPILQSTSDMYVHAECVGLQVVRAATDEVLQEAPPTAGTVHINLPGGQQIYFQVCSRGEFNVEPLSGTLYLEPLAQTRWPLRKDNKGNLATSLIQLAEREERLTGWAEVEVRTFAGVRHLRLPAFELVYPPAPMRFECAFTDTREALWVGEYHKQALDISAFPVFDRLLADTLLKFPETLPQVRIRTVDMRSGMTQMMGPESRLLEPPRAGGYEGRTVAATYFVESALPIPPADRCEIDLGGAMANLQGAMKTYAVVDPAAKGLFRWTVRQEQSDGRQAVAETLFCGEPVRFQAEWRTDQNVSAVRFEFPRPGSDESAFVEMPLTAGTGRTQLEQVVPGLIPGQILPVYVHVTMQPAGANRLLQIKVKAGQFRTEDRRVVLEDLRVGGATPTDIPGYAWEPLEIPLRAVFSGYSAGNSGHTTAIEQFKRSCAARVTSADGTVQDITGTIEWVSVEVEASARQCQLSGHAVYMPKVAGRAAIELIVEAPTAQVATGASVQRAFARVMAREPRLALAVHRLTPGGEEPVFDSRKWVKDGSGLSALTTRLSTRLQVDLQNIGTEPSPWKTTVRLLRRPAADADWLPVSSDAAELAGGDSLKREMQITDDGEYAFEMIGYDPKSGNRAIHFLTPVIASIRQYEVKPVLNPPAWVTSRVRQWPFEYRVTLFEDDIGMHEPRSVAFQFQLPGQTDVWFDGVTAPVQSEAGELRQLSARAPHFLPAAGVLSNGAARFRLSAQGLEFLRWECPNIRVIPPVLTGLTLSEGGQSAGSSDTEMVGDGTNDVWVRPAFRTAPELEGQWAASETMVYLWRGADGVAGGQADARMLERLQAQEKEASADVTGLEAFRIGGGSAGNKSLKVLTRRVRPRLWGLPRPPASERYALVAAVDYRPRQAAAFGPSGPAPDWRITEWSDIYTVQLNMPWVVPLCWWPLTAFLLAAVVVVVLRLLVPSPSRLALDMRLEENVAIVEPVRLDNPVLLDLHETPLSREMQLYTRFVGGQWDVAGRDFARRRGLGPGSVFAAILGAVLHGAAYVVAPVQVLLRRALYPRRWAWAAIIPRIRGDARCVRTALVCVWTGLTARRGRIWSSQSGSIELPPEGQVKSINLDLPYRADSVDRKMRVTVRVRRTTPEETGTTAAGWRQPGPELGS